MTPLPRKFDWDEARRMRAEGMYYSAIGRALGVSETAVRRALDPAVRQKMHTAVLEWTRKNKRAPCKGGCGTLVWTQTSGRKGYCLTCSGAQRATVGVGEGVLECAKCGEWKADEEFYSRPTAVVRRGRRTVCKVCDNTGRVERWKTNRG
jgi:hypothetical protein